MLVAFLALILWLILQRFRARDQFIAKANDTVIDSFTLIARLSRCYSHKKNGVKLFHTVFVTLKSHTMNHIYWLA